MFLPRHHIKIVQEQEWQKLLQQNLLVVNYEAINYNINFQFEPEGTQKGQTDQVVFSILLNFRRLDSCLNDRLTEEDFYKVSCTN